MLELRQGTPLLVTLSSHVLSSCLFSATMSLAAAGSFIATVASNPWVTTSSRGLRQSWLCLVWVHFTKGRSNSIVLSVVGIFFNFILALHLHCTPFAPPALIANGSPRLAILPLPCHLCGDAICALPSPHLCWSGAIVSLPWPCQPFCHIRTAATATAAAIHLFPCNHFWRTSLALDVSSLAILANADANVVIMSPRLLQRWRRCHHHIFFCCWCCPMLPLHLQLLLNAVS